MRKQEFKKNEERHRNLWGNIKLFNVQILVAPEGEEEEQEMENLFEQTMKENFPNLAKEIDFQGVPKKLDPRKHTLRHIIITLPMVRDKERILKSSKRKGDSYLQRSSHKTIS